MGSADRVRPQDAAFFYLEGPATPYHIASLMIVEGPPLDHEELLDAIGERVAFAPRLLQRLRSVPLARPRWVDDASFDLRYHVRRTSLPGPGTERQLLEVAARLHAQHLSRSRPLWECWCIEGLAGGRFALLMKIHHSLVDGVSGTELMNLFLDPAPEARTYEPEPWVPRRAPGILRLAVSSAADAVLAPLRSARRAIAEARSPTRLLRDVRDVVAGLTSIARAALDPAPASSFNVPIGPNRIIAVARAPLADLRDIKSALGGTVNDVVLAAASGGLRAVMRSRGIEPRTVTLRALVPVSLHRKDDGTQGNRVTAILAPLPVSEDDPGRRLAIIRRATRIAKASGQGAGAELLLQAGAALPPPIAMLVAGAQSVQRFFNVSVTNIAGPPTPLWIRGRRVEEIIPLRPLSANAGVIVAAMSYAGQMCFGIVADGDALPDAGLVAEGIEKSIVELRHEAGG
ncbi:MAG: wax ester/triacylglycerol synthase family O-acyltransferase [Actinomycetota bacterium]